MQDGKSPGDERAVEAAMVAVLEPLLRSIDALDLVARRLHPPDYGALMEAIGRPDDALRAVLVHIDAVSDEFAAAGTLLRAACNAVITGFDELRAAPEAWDGIRTVFRALRQGPRAKEALYPLAPAIPAVSRVFLPREKRDDAALLARVSARGDGAGVSHAANDLSERGGYSLYVPEHLSKQQAAPLIVALHGGSGHGRNFLWTWLPAARVHGAILIAPTAVGSTWALMGDDADTPNLNRIVDEVSRNWPIDASRMLLTGLSDGGTFCYVSGLEDASRFTHLAPVAAAFHPLMAQTASPERLRGLPIHITHGARDWMFPSRMAQDAARALEIAGAAVTYDEIGDLSHSYPVEVNGELLGRMERTRGTPRDERK